MLQLVSPAELSLPVHRPRRARRSGVGRASRSSTAASCDRVSRRRLPSFLDRCRTRSLRDGVDYALISTDRAPESALRDYLLRRGHMTPRRRSAHVADDLAESVGLAGSRILRVAGADSPARARTGTAPRVSVAPLSPAVTLVADETATHSRSVAARRATGYSGVGGGRARATVPAHGRATQMTRGIARAIIVDTSESMHRAMRRRNSSHRQRANRIGPAGARRTDESRHPIRESATRAGRRSELDRAPAATRRAGDRRRIFRRERSTGAIWTPCRAQRGSVSCASRRSRVRARVSPKRATSRPSARVTPSTTGSNVEWTNRAGRAGGQSSILILAGPSERNGY